MVWHGPQVRVRLDVDLTRYHVHLKQGAEGVLVPNVRCELSDDNFGAVRFDCCGAMLDVLIKSLTITDEDYLREQEREREEWLKSLTRAQDVELRLGPAGGLRSLSYRIDITHASVYDRAQGRRMPCGVQETQDSRS